MFNRSTGFLIIVITFGLGISAVTGCLYYQKSQKTQIILPNSRWESLFFDGIENKGGINQATEAARLNRLREARLKKEDVEIRIWRGFGLSPLEAVILKRRDNQWSAQHLKTDNHYDFAKVEVKELNQPKSGWELFWKQIVDKEILTLPDASEINCGDGGIDGISYVVEINQNKTYRTYKLSPDYSNVKCREADQMEEIGNIIGEEFDSGTEQCTNPAEWFGCTTAGRSNRQKTQ